MNRKETTELLTDVLIYSRLFTAGTYHAREVTLDPGTRHTKRVDVLSYTPENSMSLSGVEKGSFTCFEVKSCKADIYSGNGLNFFGEKNYLVMTAQTYQEFRFDNANGTFIEYLKETHPESSMNFGVMIPVPKWIVDTNRRTAIAEWALDNPDPFEGDSSDWHMAIAIPCHAGRRSRPMTELMFAMLRAKENYINKKAEYQYKQMELGE